MHIKIRYCSNYNGVDLMKDGGCIEWGTDPVVDAATDEMATWAVDFCNDDEGGLFEGDFDDLTTEFTTIAKKHFGDNITVEVEEDNVSS